MFGCRFGPFTATFPDTRKPHNDSDFRAFQPAAKGGLDTPSSRTSTPPCFAGASGRLVVPERLPGSTCRRRPRHGSTGGAPSGNGDSVRRRVLGPDGCRRDARDKAPIPLKGNYYHRTRKASDGAIDLGVLRASSEAQENDRGVRISRRSSRSSLPSPRCWGETTTRRRLSTSGDTTSGCPKDEAASGSSGLPGRPSRTTSRGPGA